MGHGGTSPGLLLEAKHVTNRAPRPTALSDPQLALINQLTTIARFVSGLAHELNNSLQVVGGLVELLEDRADLPPDAAVRIRKIGGQSEKASAAIRQVLGYMRVPDGRPGALDLAAVTERSLALRRYALGRAGVQVTWKRQAGSGARTWGYERQVQQVILNLLINAEEALRGGVDRRLHLDISRADDSLRLTVADSGPGVPTEIGARVFEPFFTTREDAVGLGLTVGAAIAAAHDGSLTLAGTGPGATFVLQLPAR
jgi:signal transduction histidine kinase